MKINIIWYSDFICQTGYGIVASELVSRLLRTGKYVFTVVGVNYHGEPFNIPESPYYRFKDVPVYPARHKDDYLGRRIIVELLRDSDVDLLFVLQDPFNLVQIDAQLKALRALKKFKYIFYVPIDGDLDASWISNAIQTADYPVAYTLYGLGKIHEHIDTLPMRVIYHGVDREAFQPASKEERDALRDDYFGVNRDAFIITNVNRNQPRKDIPRTIFTWLKVKERIPNAKLYLNMNVLDPSGYDLPAIIQRYVSPSKQKEIWYPNPDNMGSITREMLRKFYCASDVVVSTTLGEGWGMSTTEAMACRVPVAMPRNTSTEEIVGANEERGYLARCDDCFMMAKNDNNQIRPLTSVEDLADKICRVHDHPEEAAEKVDAAYDWITEHCDWDKIAEQWDELFTLAYEQVKKARKE